VPSGIGYQTPVWPTSTATALVKEHDAIFIGAEEASHPGLGASARATVQQYYGLALRIAAFLKIDAMPGVDA